MSRARLAAIAIALAAAGAAVAAGAARARVAEPPVFGNSTIPAIITLVGHDGAGTPDPLGRFQVVIRDLANNPVPGVTLTADFSGAPDLVLASAQPGLGVDCGGRIVSGVTDAHGVWTACIVGGAIAGAPASPAGSVHLYANGSLLGSPTVAALDLDTASGVGVQDMSLWLSDFVTALGGQRADYDGSGSVGANDLSLWLKAYGAGGSAVSGAACP